MDRLRPRLRQLASRIPPLRPGRFGWGAAQLTAATLLSRAIGFVYSAAVMRLAGPEAVGLFRVAWPLYATAFTLATSGVPYAMAKLLAEQADLQGPTGPIRLDPARAERARAVARVGLLILTATSSLAALLLRTASPWLMGRLASEPRAIVLVQLLAPSLLLAALASGCRALFEGVRRMSVPAASLLVEQAVLAGLAILLVALLAGQRAGPEQAAVALAMASVAGEAAGLVVLALFVNRLWSSWRRPPASPPGGSATARGARHPGTPAATPPDRWALQGILALALPVAGGRVLASVGAGFNSLVLPNRLQAAGLSASEAAAQIGLLRGVALPIVLMPNMLSVALMTTLVPSISQAMAQGRPDLARLYSDKATAATLLFALPVTAALAAFPESITRLLYGEAQAAPLLLIAAAAAPFVYLGQTLVGVLRGLGRPHVPVQAHLAGLAVDTLVVALLAGRPSIGVQGGAWASVAGFATAYAINQMDTLRRLGTGLQARRFALPFLGALMGALFGRAVGAGAFAAAAAAGAPTFLADLAGLAAGMAALAVIYGTCLLRCPLWPWLVAR